jgi:hypothetical protein
MAPAGTAMLQFTFKVRRAGIRDQGLAYQTVAA